MVYYVASVVVLYSAEAHTQRHYRGHTEDIESICVHPQVKYTTPKIPKDNLIPRKPCVQPARLPLLETKTRHMSRSSVPIPPYEFNTVIRSGIMKLWSWFTSLALVISPTG